VCRVCRFKVFINGKFADFSDGRKSLIICSIKEYIPKKIGGVRNA
jgi:hypothetical protein